VRRDRERQFAVGCCLAASARVAAVLHLPAGYYQIVRGTVLPEQIVEILFVFPSRQVYIPGDISWQAKSTPAFQPGPVSLDLANTGCFLFVLLLDQRDLGIDLSQRRQYDRIKQESPAAQHDDRQNGHSDQSFPGAHYWAPLIIFG
jgi:hypothetical protein